MAASSGIVVCADGIRAELKQRLPKQRKTQRDKLALLVATMLHVRSANLVELASGLPRESDRLDTGHQRIGSRKTSTGELASSGGHCVEAVALTGNGIKRPVSRIALSHRGNMVPYFAFVDSGADINLFHAELASLLGLDLEAGEKHGTRCHMRSRPCSGVVSDCRSS